MRIKIETILPWCFVWRAGLEQQPVFFIVMKLFLCNINLFSSTWSTFSCIINYCLPSQSNFLCNLSLFLQTPLHFLCNINFFLNIKLFFSKFLFWIFKTVTLQQTLLKILLQYYCWFKSQKSYFVNIFYIQMWLSSSRCPRDAKF